jgi:hypothetical protein
MEMETRMQDDIRKAIEQKIVNHPMFKKQNNCMESSALLTNMLHSMNDERISDVNRLELYREEEAKINPDMGYHAGVILFVEDVCYFVEANNYVEEGLKINLWFEYADKHGVEHFDMMKASELKKTWTGSVLEPMGRNVKARLEMEKRC